MKAIDLGVSAGSMALIASIQPLVKAALAAPVLGESVRPEQWLGLVIGFAGVMLAVAAEPSDAPTWAYGMAFLGTAAFIGAKQLSKVRGDTTDLISGLGIQSIAATILFAPIAAYEGSLFAEIDSYFIIAVGWFVVFSTLGGFGLYWLCLRRSTVTHVGSLLYLSPPVTMIWAWLMFSQPLTWQALAGFGLCISGVILADEKRRWATR